jgi:hypothetical protein
MKQGARIPKDELASVIQQVLTIFQEINKFQSASKAHTFELVKLFKLHPLHFQQAWELAYLKIFKIFHERQNRKMPPKYENLATTLFAELLPKDGHPEPACLTFFDFFLDFLSEAVFSLNTGIRITSARMLFHLLKCSGQHAGAKAR